MDLPVSELGSCSVSRLIIGGNPFSGFSHQTAQLDWDMRNYFTAAKIKETLAACEEAGINTFFGRSDNHVLRLLNEYRNEGGKIQYFAQTASERTDTAKTIRQVADYGAEGCYLHGGEVDTWHEEERLDHIGELVELIKELGMVAGVAGHNPRAHLDIHAAGIPVDFHMVCFYNLEGRRGNLVAEDEYERFDDRDRDTAVETIRRIPTRCVGYKVLAAARRDPAQAFRFAFENMKPGDCINVGMYTKNDPDMITRNVELVTSILRELGQ
jgi:hypothetical protein